MDINIHTVLNTSKVSGGAIHYLPGNAYFNLRASKNFHIYHQEENSRVAEVLLPESLMGPRRLGSQCSVTASSAPKVQVADE